MVSERALRRLVVHLELWAHNPVEKEGDQNDSDALYVIIELRNLNQAEDEEAWCDGDRNDDLSNCQDKNTSEPPCQNYG